MNTLADRSTQANTVFCTAKYPVSMDEDMRGACTTLWGGIPYSEAPPLAPDPKGDSDDAEGHRFTPADKLLASGPTIFELSELYYRVQASCPRPPLDSATRTHNQSGNKFPPISLPLDGWSFPVPPPL